MLKICFVAQELAPFTAGGIGVMLKNLICQYAGSEVELNILGLEDWNVDDVTFSVEYPNVKRWLVADLIGEQIQGKHPPEWAFTTHPWHYRSYQVAQALGNLALQGIDFDVVEFADWGGLAFCATQEKLLGRWKGTKIAVRLHSTDSILRAGQPVNGSAGAAHLADLERKSLRDADVIVAHLETVARVTKEHFGFDDEWWGRVRVDAPPVPVKPCSNSLVFDAHTPICFPSKIQGLKRPDVFLNGVLAFLNSTPEYQGNVVFMAHPTDGGLQQELERRVPARLTDRISFATKVPEATRTALLARAITVFPSPFESFCLAAYEVSLSGGWVALNHGNPAFNDQTAWVDGENCLKFDGTALSLAENLALAWHSRSTLSLAPINHKPTTRPYWLDAGANGKSEKERPSALKVDENMTPLVSVVIPYYNMGRYIVKTLESVLASGYRNIEIVLVDDSSTDEHSRMVLDVIQSAERFGVVRVVRAPANLGLSGARNLGIREARGEYVLTLDSDDLIREDFIAVAVAALERNPEYSIVIPQTAFFADEACPSHLNVVDHAIFIGEAVRSGTFANRFSTATSLGRTAIYREYPYDESLNSYEDWDFYSRLAWAGKRFIVTSEIYFYYRRRAGSMIAQNNKDKHARNIAILRSKQRATNRYFAFDMNIVCDAEGYAEFLNAHAISHRTKSETTNELDKVVSMSQMRSLLDQRDKELHDAHAKLAAVQAIVVDARQIAARTIQSKPRNPFFFKKLRRKLSIKKAVRDLIGSGLFDGAWYLREYPDVARSGMDPALHYVMFGRDEGRAPKASGLTPTFGTPDYGQR